MALRLFSLLVGLGLLSGCGDSGPRLVPVKGTVRFGAGQLPEGEVRVIRFEPIGGSKPQTGGKASTNAQDKAASSDIRADGSFALSTNHPNDGAYEGNYKVTFSIWKTYLGREPLIPARYAKPDSTPFEVTVKAGESNEFTFELEQK
jgi:hypothetical protein